jgi:hypothetical protein
MLKNITDESDEYFTRQIEKLGIADLTMEKMKKTKIWKNDTEIKDENWQGKLDAKTIMVQDRVINNLPNLSLDPSNRTLAERLTATLKDAASSLLDAIDFEELKKAYPHHLAYKTKKSLLNMGLAEILNLARSLTIATESIAGNVYAAILQFIPLFWNTALTMFTMPIKIPFLERFWHEKFQYVL